MNKKNKLTDRFAVQAILVIAIALISIFIAIVLSTEDIKITMMMVYIISGSCLLALSIYNYVTTKRDLKRIVMFGLTRKSVYKSNVFLQLLVSIILLLLFTYVILLTYFIHNIYISFIYEGIFIIVIINFASSIGLLLGLCKWPIWLMLVVIFALIGGTVVFFDRVEINIYYVIVSVVIEMLLGFINYKIMINKKI